MMEAGRELNALVAEKVMGWRWVVMQRVKPIFGGGAGDEIDCLIPPDCPDSGPLRLGFIVKRGAVHEGCGDWSTDIAAAWPVVEKMRTMGKPLYLIPYRDGWMVGHDNGEGYLDHQDTAFGGTVDSHLFNSATAPTAPHAICLAVLEAVAG